MENASGSLGRACCHEAGQVICALHFDFPIRAVEVHQGMVRISTGTIPLTPEGASFFAAGAAAERLLFGGFDEGPIGRDRAQHASTQAGSFESSVTRALEILGAHLILLKTLINDLYVRWVQEQASCEAAFNFDASAEELSFPLMTAEELLARWNSGGGS